jgi:hypothetical protein
MVIKRVLIVVLFVFLVGCVTYTESCDSNTLGDIDNVCYGGHPIPVHSACASVLPDSYQTSSDHCLITPKSAGGECSYLKNSYFKKSAIAIEADWLSGSPEVCLFSCSVEADCPALQQCVPFGDENVCTPKCTSNADCLPSVTVCSDMGWCVPTDTKAEVCTNGVDDDYDGAVDCGDLDCSEGCRENDLIVYKQAGSIDKTINWLGAMSKTAEDLCSEGLGLNCKGLSVIGAAPGAPLNSAFKNGVVSCDAPFSEYKSKIDALTISDPLKEAIKNKGYEVQCDFICNGDVCADNKQMCDSTLGCVSCKADTDCTVGSCSGGLCSSDEVFCSVTDDKVIGSSGSNPSKCELRFRQLGDLGEGYIANKECFGVISGVPLLALQDELMSYGSLTNNNHWFSSDWSSKCPVTFATQHGGWALYGSVKVPHTFAEAEKCINEGKNQFGLFDTRCLAVAGGTCSIHDDCLITEACDTENNVCVVCEDGDAGKDTTLETTVTGVWLGTATATVGKIATSTDFCMDGKVSEFFCQKSTKTGSEHTFVHSNNIFCEENHACKVGVCVKLEPSEVPEQCDNGIDNDEDGLTTCKDIECATADLCKKADRVMIKEFGDYVNTENWLVGDVTKTAENICQNVLGMGCTNVHYELPGSGTSALNKGLGEGKNLAISCATPFSAYQNELNAGEFWTDDPPQKKNAYFAICGELCNNKKDDDGDGLVDCADPDCIGKTGMLDTGKTVVCCQSNTDTDSDGIADQCSDYRPLCNEEKLYCESPGDVNGDFTIDSNDLVYLQEHLKVVWGLFGVWDNSQLTQEQRLVKLNQAVVHIIKKIE